MIHPNRTSFLVGGRFSADGKRLVAGDYPGGVVVVWDVASGKQLKAIETGYGYRGSTDYFFLTPDWQTLFVSRSQRKVEQVEQGGRPLLRWTFDGTVRAWDLASGRLLRTYQHQPPRGILGMVLAPDGMTFATFEELPGIYGRPKDAASLWDVRTRHFRPLPGHLYYWSVYAPDGRTLAAPSETEGGRVTVRLFDVATAQEKLSIPIQEKASRVAYLAYAPDGKLLVGQVRDEGKTGQHWLKFWDPATGQEVASFEGEKNDYFMEMAFSPAGRTLAATNGRGKHGKLFLFDVRGRKLARTVIVGEAAKGEIVITSQPAFSPDGRWLAVTTQALPDTRGSEPDIHDLPQPRIHLIDLAAGVVRETLVAPQGFAHGLCCFSPDGRTLATGGCGRILLWDMGELPGKTAQASRFERD